MTDGLRYLLDTDVISHLLRDPEGPVARRLLERGADRAATSIAVACEVRFGIARSGSRRLARRVEQFLERIEVLPLDLPVDQLYGAMRAELERAGTPIGPNDLLIAAHARALGLTMVTGNAREFSRVPGLEVEDWIR